MGEEVYNRYLSKKIVQIAIRPKSSHKGPTVTTILQILHRCTPGELWADKNAIYSVVSDIDRDKFRYLNILSTNSLDIIRMTPSIRSTSDKY